MPTTGTWRAVPALAAPIQVSASGAPQRVSGDVVRASTFASATTGWAAVRADTPPISCLLRTEDAGTTWTCQLAWSGDVLGRLHAFDGHRASLLLGLRSGFRNEINGLPVAAGEPFYHFVAGTQDAGATWTLGSPVDRHTAGAYFLSPLQIWLQVHVPGSDFTSDLARTEDGGATWSRIDGTGYPPGASCVPCRESPSPQGVRAPCPRGYEPSSCRQAPPPWAGTRRSSSAAVPLPGPADLRRPPGAAPHSAARSSGRTRPAAPPSARGQSNRTPPRSP